MNTFTYFVKYNINGKSGGTITVEARNSSEAKSMAMAEIQSKPACVGQRIYIASVSKR